MQDNEESPLLGGLYFILAFVCGTLVFWASFIGGVMSFVLLAFLLPNRATHDYYETVTVCTYLVYVLIVSILICLAATNRARKKLVGVFLFAAAAFWLVHDAIPLGLWTPCGLITVAALPLYQILVQRTRH